MFEPDIEFPGVQIWDDLLDDRFILDLDEKSNYFNWTLNNIANKRSYPNFTKGSHLLWGVKLYEKNNPNKSFDPIIKDLYLHLTKNVISQNFDLISSHLNGQFIGQKGSCHIDSKPNSKSYTLMVFINYKWKKEWGGEFQLLKKCKDNIEVTHSIEYIPGRVILFDGSIPHRGLDPLETNVFRKSLIFRIEKT